MMKRTAAWLLAFALALCAGAARADGETAAPGTASLLNSAVDRMDAQALLQLRDRVDARLRTLGAYPFVALKSGSKGDEVTALQTRLKELGYYAKEVGATYDSATVSAMKAFEKANGLKQDGAASVADQQALYSAEALLKPTPTPSPTPRPTATPNRSKLYPEMNFRSVGAAPDDYAGQRMSLTGVVLQALPENGGWRLRVATEGDRGGVVYVTTDALTFEPAEGTKVVCYGVFEGLYTYQTAEGMAVSLPALTGEIVEKIG